MDCGLSVFSASMRITFLGTGTSHGVPSIDCALSRHAHCRQGVCAACATDPRHARTRCSLLLDYNDRSVLCDVSMDFRAQALRERFPAVHAVLLTHRHMDHMGGLPDLRSYTPTPVPVYGSRETIEEIHKAYAYMSDPNAFAGGGITRVDAHVADAPFELFGQTVTPVPVEHGILQGCLGWRVGPLAYIPDLKRLKPGSLELLRGIDTLIIDLLRVDRPHATHVIMPESFDIARAVAPRQCYFVHMSHDIHYQLDKQYLEPWMEFAWDGLKVTIGTEE